MELNSGIYGIFNKLNNKVYVGSTINFNKRKMEHFRYLGKNTHHSSHLQNSYNKYKKENFIFKILEYCEEDLLIDREIFWIDKMDSLNPDFGYNMTPPITCNLEEREEIKLKKRIAAYNQFYKDVPITLDEYLAGKRKKDLFKKEALVCKKEIICIDKITGEIQYIFESIRKASYELGVNEKYISRILNQENKTCKNLILIECKNYIPGKDYRINYKTKNPNYFKEIYNYEKKGPFLGHPIKSINIESNEVKNYNNIKEIVLEHPNMKEKGIRKVLNNERKSYKGFTFIWLPKKFL